MFQRSVGNFKISSLRLGDFWSKTPEVWTCILAPCSLYFIWVSWMLKVNTEERQWRYTTDGNLGGGMEGEKLWCRWKMFGRLVGQEMIGEICRWSVDTTVVWRCSMNKIIRKVVKMSRDSKIWKRHSFLGLKLVMQKILCVFFSTEGLLNLSPTWVDHSVRMDRGSDFQPQEFQTNEGDWGNRSKSLVNSGWWN